MSNLPLEIRKIIVQEIYNWEKEGLLSAAQARAILVRYTDVPTPDSQPASHTPVQVTPSSPPAPHQPQPTLIQTLLSETSIKIALYLGAFFVIGAALIFAALVETLRLPILMVVALLFCTGALILKKRLPQPSFVLFLVFSMLLLISGNVLAESLHLTGKATTGYWITVMACIAVLWAFSTWLYRSRFFSLLSFGALGVAVGLGVHLVDDAQVDLYLLILTISGFSALAGTWLLKRWQGRNFAMPLFVLAHIQQLFILLIALVYEALHGFGLVSSTNWLVAISIWLLASVFYILSDLVISFELFPFMAVGALLLIPWPILSELKPQNYVYALGWSLWGALFAIVGEIFGLIKLPKFRQYGLPLSLGALGLLGLGALVGWVDSISVGFGLFLGAALLLAVLHIFLPRWWMWSTALLFALLAYFLCFYLPGLEPPKGLPVYQFIAATILLLLPDLFLKADLNANKVWRWPLRIYAGLLILCSTLVTLVSGMDDPQKAAIAFGVLAAFFLVYALRYARPITGQPELGFLFTGYLTLTIIFVTRLFVMDRWLWPLIGLATIYYIAGSLLAGIQETGHWQRVFSSSGLLLGTLTALSAPLEHSGLAASFPVAIAATLWAAEAFRRRNVWLGFPANGLYLMAYFMILVELKVTEPQFFSVGAAVLGMLMHYLLMRSGSKTGTFITGTLSQLVLLSTTLYQMWASQQLSFFVALFFQSLVVLAYGLVIRSRSLVAAPIVFVVIGVILVALSALKGISLVILIGMAGMLLLALAILAIVMRERIASLSEQMGGWNA